MTAARAELTLPVAAAALLAVAAGAAWWWRVQVFSTTPATIMPEQWQHVRQQYPAPEEAPPPAALAPETIETIVNANPFSAMRRFVPPAKDDGTHGPPGGSASVSAPQFIYKGLVSLGSRQRAIVEDTTIRKTYFLEVGQEVTGFKVLDIAENRVLLSDVKTNKELVVSVAEKKAP